MYKGRLKAYQETCLKHNVEQLKLWWQCSGDSDINMEEKSAGSIQESALKLWIIQEDEVY